MLEDDDKDRTKEKCGKSIMMINKIEKVSTYRTEDNKTTHPIVHMTTDRWEHGMIIDEWQHGRGHRQSLRWIMGNDLSKIQPLAYSWRKGVTSLDGERDYGQRKPRCEVSCRGLYGAEVVIAVPLRGNGQCTVVLCLPLIWDSSGGDFFPRFSWNENGTRE
jgi:hypothetical protein